MKSGLEAGRIASLLEPYVGRGTLSAAQLAQVAAYLELLLEWNRRLNLTAVRGPEEMVERHFGESFFAARHLLGAVMRRAPGVAPGRILKGPADDRPGDECLSGFRINDVGSGAGFPGLPLKIFAPEISLLLVESNARKATFLNEVIRRLALSEASVFIGRAETLAERMERQAELVTMRAVERFARVLPVAARVVAPGGRLALLIGAVQEDPSRKALPGFAWEPALLIPRSHGRILLVGRRTGPSK